MAEFEVGDRVRVKDRPVDKCGKAMLHGSWGDVRFAGERVVVTGIDGDMSAVRHGPLGDDIGNVLVHNLEPLTEVWRAMAVRGGRLTSMYNARRSRRYEKGVECQQRCTAFESEQIARDWVGAREISHVEVWRCEAVVAGTASADGPCWPGGTVFCKHLMPLERVAVYRDGKEVVMEHTAAVDRMAEPVEEKEDRAMAKSEQLRAMAAVVAATMKPNNRSSTWGTGNAKPAHVVGDYRENAKGELRCARADVNALADALEHLFAITTLERQRAIRDGTVAWPAPDAEREAERVVGGERLRAAKDRADLFQAEAERLEKDLGTTRQMADALLRVLNEVRAAAKLKGGEDVVEAVREVKALTSRLGDALGSAQASYRRIQEACSATGCGDETDHATWIRNLHATLDRSRGEASELRAILKSAEKRADLCGEFRERVDELLAERTGLREQLAIAGASEGAHHRYIAEGFLAAGCGEDEDYKAFLRRRTAELEALAIQCQAALDREGAAGAKLAVARKRCKALEATERRLRGEVERKDALLTVYRTNFRAFKAGRAADARVVEAAVALKRAWDSPTASSAHLYEPLEAAIEAHPAYQAAEAEPARCDKCGQEVKGEGA